MELSPEAEANVVDEDPHAMKMNRTLATFLLVGLAIPLGCKKDKPTDGGTEKVATDAEVRQDASTPAPDAAKKELIAETKAAIDELVRAFESQQSVHMQFETSASYIPGRDGRTGGSGDFAILRTPEATFRRVNINNIHVVRVDDAKQVSVQEILVWVTDGVTLTHWAAVKTGSETTQTEYRHADMLQIGGSELFGIIQRGHVLTLTGKDTLDGRPVVIFEAKPKNGKGKTRHWFDAETGARIRYTEWDAAGEIYFKLRMTELTSGKEFPGDWFEPEFPDFNKPEDPSPE